jgi:chromosome partitioning protein
MHVISVLNQKGGVGKTTVATNLARAFQLRGKSSALVDSDPQGSARDWAAVRSDQPLLTVGLDRPTLDRDVTRLPAGIVVIDGAPQVATLAASAARAASLVLIPVAPSPYDVWASNEMVDLVLQRQAIMDGQLKAAFVISRAMTGTVLSREIAATLADYGLPVLNSVIHQRVAYASTAARGETVVDNARVHPEAAAEVNALADEVLDLLGER